MSEENKRTTRQVHEELFEKGNLEAADELIHPPVRQPRGAAWQPAGSRGPAGDDQLAA
jgi:hypothetical protein